MTRVRCRLPVVPAGTRLTSDTLLLRTSLGCGAGLARSTAPASSKRPLRTVSALATLWQMGFGDGTA